ncbi:MAG: periplasmic heavy metal sensor [Candidatus Berkiella sp.]
MRIPHSLKIIFFLSIVLNVFLIGYVIGGKKTFPFHRPMHEPIFFEALKDLPKESKKRLKQSFHESREKLKENRAKIKNERQEIAILLVKDPIDEAKIKAHLKAIQKLANESLSISQDSLLDALLAATPEERKQIAENLSKNKRFDRRH